MKRSILKQENNYYITKELETQFDIRGLVYALRYQDTWTISIHVQCMEDNIYASYKWKRTYTEGNGIHGKYIPADSQITIRYVNGLDNATGIQAPATRIYKAKNLHDHSDLKNINITICTASNVSIASKKRKRSLRIFLSYTPADKSILK